MRVAIVTLSDDWSTIVEVNEITDDFEEDPKERLIRRLQEYQQYKEIVSSFRKLEETRNLVYTKEPSNLSHYKTEDTSLSPDITLDKLLNAFQELLKRKEYVLEYYYNYT